MHAKAYLEKDMVSFWKGMKKENISRLPLPSKVDNCVGEEEISNMWQIHYQSLLNSVESLASVFNNYFVTKIADLRKEFPDLEVHAAQLSITDFDISLDLSSSRLSSFTPTTVSEVQELLSIMNQTTCSLDPFNTKIVMQYSEQFILSKLIEKVIARRLFAHLQDNGIMEKFQSAYKAKHSTETALLRLYNDVMLCIDQGKGCISIIRFVSSI